MSVITFYIQYADTLAFSSLEKSFTPLTMDFCSKAVQVSQRILQLGNCFGYSMVFVAIASSKDVG